MFTFHLCNSRKCIAPRFIARSVNLKLHPRKITQSGCKDGLVDIFRRHFRAETLAEIYVRMCSPAASHSDFLLSVWYEIFNMNAAYPTESIHSLSIQKVFLSVHSICDTLSSTSLFFQSHASLPAA